MHQCNPNLCDGTCNMNEEQAVLCAEEEARNDMIALLSLRHGAAIPWGTYAADWKSNTGSMGHMRDECRAAMIASALGDLPGALADQERFASLAIRLPGIVAESIRAARATGNLATDQDLLAVGNNVATVVMLESMT